MKKLKKGVADTLPKGHYTSQSDLESLMASLPLANKNTQWHELVWSLRHKTHLVKLDFRQLTQLSQQYPSWATRFGFAPVLFAKTLLVLATRDHNGATTIRNYYSWIAKALFFLARQDVVYLGRENLIDFITFQLLHDYNKAPTMRVHLLSYRQFILSPSVAQLAEYSAVTGLPPLFDRSVTERNYWQMCKAAIESYSEGSLTFTDWKDGGSFDYLTLNYGQYYIEHCIQIFEKHYPMAMALKSVLVSYKDIFTKAGLSWAPKRLKQIVRYLVPAINGVSTTPNISIFSQSKWSAIVRLAQGQYEYFYRTQLVQREMVGERALESTADALAVDLASLPDALDWFRQMVELVLEFDADTTFDIDVRSKAQSILGPRLDLEKLRQYLVRQRQELMTTCEVHRPTPIYFSSIGIEAKSKLGPGVQYAHFLSLIECCGFTAFMAINGWRGSEYGFTLSDIDIASNRDLLEQWNNPLRFSVRWLVPKVHGENKLDREITFNSYRICARMARLLGAGTKKPCLYTTIATKLDLSNSSANARSAASYAWEHFLEHYESFKQIDQVQWPEYLRLCQLRKDQHSGIRLSEQDQNQLEKLIKREQAGDWDHWIERPFLLSAYQRTRDERQRTRFRLIRRETKPKLLLAFAQNSLEGPWHDLFSQHLNEDTISFLRSLTKKEDLTRSIVKAINDEILEGCVYPTPHALRHMWAEAVFRRFDGDVGWMIRSQFKHISQSMWLAYLRDKQRNDLATVKRQVVSDLLAHYVQKAGSGYAGGMDRRLRLMMQKTKFASVEEMTTRITEYGLQNVKDIKASPYGFCLLQRRNQAKAKCAVDDEPQRQNAAPEFCFGCQFNLSMTSNLPNILLSIANHRNVLQESTMLPSYRSSALETVKNALVQIRKLDASAEIIAGIEADLKIGEKLYQNGLRGEAV